MILKTLYLKMQTTNNNTEPTAVIIQPTDNLAPQQISHVKSFKTLGILQIVFGGISLILSLIELIGMAHIIEATLSLFLCCGWKIGFMLCSVIGAVIVSPITFFISIGMGITQTLDKSSNWNILSFFITLLSCVVGLVAIISAFYCCCCSPLKTPSQQINSQEMDAVMGPSQPEINLNAPGNQMLAPNMLSLIDTAGYTVLHPRAQPYYFVGVTDQRVGYTQNPNVACSHPPIYINA